MVVEKLFEFIEDIERFCVNHKWSRFFNDWETGDEVLDDYAMIYKNCCNDVDEEKDAANDIFTELTQYMDCLYNYIDDDCVKVLDDEKQNARKWLDKVENIIGSCVFSLKGNDLKGFLIKGYQMCHLIKEAAVKTSDEYYGGRRTDVMPYYLGESKEQLFDSILNEASQEDSALLGEGLDNPRFVGGSFGSRWFNWSGDIKSPEPVYHYLGVVHEVDADYYVDKYGETTECRFAAVEFDTKEEAIEAAKKAMIFDGTPDYEKVDREFKKVNESDDTYKAKVTGKGWLKGHSFTDKKADADTFESKTEPTQRINQMKKDGKLNKNAKPNIVKESIDPTSSAFNLTKLKGYLRFETRWEYDEDYPEDAMLVDKVHDPARFTVNWIGPEGKKHPNTYCVNIRKDRGESWTWVTHFCLKASDAAEMINLEVGTWEHNNMSWKFGENKEFLFDMLLEAVEDFPKNTRAMYRFAKRRHDDTGAIRKVSKQPYWVHPEGVAKIVMEHSGSDIEIKAAMAHDVLEDTGESYEDMVEKFGEKVASIVKEVTNDKDEVAKVGKEKYISEELCRLSPEALTVKLADMLYNMKDSPTEKNYERMRKNIAFLMMNRQLDGKHLELAQEILEV